MSRPPPGASLASHRSRQKAHQPPETTGCQQQGLAGVWDQNTQAGFRQSTKEISLVVKRNGEREREGAECSTCALHSLRCKQVETLQVGARAMHTSSGRGEATARRRKGPCAVAGAEVRWLNSALLARRDTREWGPRFSLLEANANGLAGSHGSEPSGARQAGVTQPEDGLHQLHRQVNHSQHSHRHSGGPSDGRQVHTCSDGTCRGRSREPLQ